MSLLSSPLSLNASVHFQSPWALALTAATISERLFNGIPFSSEIPGLRDEVPAVKLTQPYFGLFVDLYGTWEGDHGEYTLNAETGDLVRDHYGLPSRYQDIGQWLAQLVATIPEFKVVGYSPVEIQPPRR